MKKILVIWIGLLLFSCTKENSMDCFKSNGADVVQTRYPGRFDSVEVQDNFEVTIRKGSDYSVQITAGKHIIGNISSSVKNSWLVIANKNACNFVRGYKRKLLVTITAPHYGVIYNNGVGNLTLDENLSQDTLGVKTENSGITTIQGTYLQLNSESTGNGDVYYKGKAKGLRIYMNGTGYTYAQEGSVSDYLNITTNSLGNAYLDLDGLKTLEYQILNSGNIYYKKNPGALYKTPGEDMGEGKLIKQD
jgi:hypothetical protein